MQRWMGLTTVQQRRGHGLHVALLCTALLGAASAARVLTADDEAPSPPGAPAGGAAAAPADPVIRSVRVPTVRKPVVAPAKAPPWASQIAPAAATATSPDSAPPVQPAADANPSPPADAAGAVASDLDAGVAAGPGSALPSSRRAPSVATRPLGSVPLVPPPTPPGPLAEDGDVFESAGAADVLASDAAATTIRVDQATLRGVTPGETTVEELSVQWGAGRPQKRSDGSQLYVYSMEPFRRVDAVTNGRLVTGIVIHLPAAAATADVVEQLSLTDVTPVIIPDEAGKPLGQAFAERGVMFSFKPGTQQVAQVLIEPIDLEPFLVRAEATQHSKPKQSLADIDYVLSQKPEHALAHWLRARLLAAHGQYETALEHAQQAARLDARQPSYRLTEADILGKLGRYDQALALTRQVLAGNLAEEVRARAECQLGDQLAASPQREYKLAMEHHLAAIKRAEPLATDRRAAVRRMAKEVLLDANLGVAGDVAWGNWQQKDRVVPKWLTRANEYAEDLVRTEAGDAEVRLRVAREALAACAGAQGQLDPSEWTKSALSITKQQLAVAADPWRRGRLQWILGVALYDALQADQARGYHEHALPNAALVASYLESGSTTRQMTSRDEFMIGRLYFRIGSLHAVEKQDHRAAVAWYDKARPYLERPLPDAAWADLGRRGESLVSMGVSYWETGNRSAAVQLTQDGVELMVRAAENQGLAPAALAVPYGNLAAMHRALGQNDASQSFAALAAKYEAQAETTRQ